MRKPNLNSNNLYILVLAVILIIVAVFFYISGSKKEFNDVWRDGAATIGTAKAPISIVEFGSFSCASCVEITPIIHQIILDNPSKIIFQFRYFPDPTNPNSSLAAQYAELANRKGKFWEMYDMLMQNQVNWSSSDKAKDIFDQFLILNGLNKDLDKDLQAAKETVESDVVFANQNDLVGTPTLFINGKLYSKDLTYLAIKDEIDSALK
jgi:protein-disulfide isomerase